MSVFGALNRFISRLDGEPQQQNGPSPNNAYGFQVLRNTNADVLVEPWFDFIIGINGRQIDNGDPSLFATEIRNCAGNSVNLGVWSAKGQRIRSLYVQVPPGAESIGLSLQWTPVASTEEVWHVLDVAPNSPADLAGLLPYGDYIIGSPEGLVRGEAGFGELVEHFLEKPLRIHVYNHEYNVTREVQLTPSKRWGGTGALGCVLGYGALHRIPPSLEEPPQAPGETLFEGEQQDASSPAAATGAPPAPPAAGGQFFVPASAPSPGPPAAKSGGGRKARTHHTGKAGDMDAYFAEGEAKSREQDFAPKPKAGLAPPPKAGAGPPRAATPQDEKAAEATS